MVKFANIKGLSDEEVQASRQKYGSNGLPPAKVQSFWDKLKDNFGDPIVHILLGALVITLVLALFGYADLVEGLGIAVAVFLATFISTFSEFKNESSFRELQAQASNVSNKVFRKGIPTEILVDDVVVGDFVLLQAGDKVPADGIIIEGEIHVNQATLNGENDAVAKIPPANKDFDGYNSAEKDNYLDNHLVFRGSVVDEGEAVFKARIVGQETSFGRLFTELASAKERPSPLQVKLGHLAEGVSTVGYIGATAIAVSFLFKKCVIDNGYDFDKIKAYVALDNITALIHDLVTSVILGVIVIVVAVPEGLPMMIALVLSLNMRKLLASKVLVRKLLGIETAGSLDVLFTDKTGTLTKGKFEPRVFISGASNQYTDFFRLAQPLADSLSFSVRESSSSNIGEDGKAVGGNSSDRALLEFIHRFDIQRKGNVVSGSHKLVREVLFSSVRKFSAIQLQLNPNTTLPHFKSGGETLTLIKGAPDILFPYTKSFYDEEGKKIPFTPEHLKNINDAIDENSKKGVRVIGLATSTHELHGHNLPAHVDLVGIIGIVDEIREESAPAIELARSAGVHTIMITGDRLETAIAVATDLGLLKPGQIALTSNQLSKMSDETIASQVLQVGVIARALPTDKSRLVRITQSLNKVVGMTGDGVNDSAALKEADVGFGMGSGSEVAKEASDIVILDDNFKSITQAVLYGRTIFKSIRKFIVFQLTVNTASFLIVFLGPFFGFDFPLTLIQLLWINLVMDTLAAMAFGGEPALERYMHEPPIKRDETIISSQMWCSVLVNAVAIASVCIFSLKSDYVKSFFIRDGEPSQAAFLTAFFAFFIFLTNFNSFNVRTPKINIFDNLFKNPGFVLVAIIIFTVQIIFTEIGGNILRTIGLTLHEWLLVAGVAAFIIPFDMLRKFISGFILPEGGF